MYIAHARSKECAVAGGALKHAAANCLWMAVCLKYAAHALLRATLASCLLFLVPFVKKCVDVVAGFLLHGEVSFPLF